MTAMMLLTSPDGRNHTSYHRSIASKNGLAELRERFFGNRHTFQKGELYQLKGKDRILLAEF